MAIILNIESSTTNCSAALTNGVEVLISRSVNNGYSHAERLAPFVDEILNERKGFGQLQAIAVSGGPGSYTGLRIGVSLAKGLCYALNLPLISISTLEIMCQADAVKKKCLQLEKPLLCPMLDARRMEVYTAQYDLSSRQINPEKPHILDDDSFAEELSNGHVVFFGNGASKFKEICHHDKAHFVDNIWPDASQMAILSAQKFENGDFVSTAYFEPNYLKTFQTTTPKKLF